MMCRRPGNTRATAAAWWCCVVLAAVSTCSGATVPSTSSSDTGERADRSARTMTDLLWTGLEGVIQQRSGLPRQTGAAESKQLPDKRCECQSPELKSCVCCLKMSLPFLDLTTSPGCVKFKYIPDIGSIAVNVTYGKGNVQNGVIKVSNPESVCMDVLVGFGQLCAKFVGNSSTPKDFDGCLKLEATLLNEVQNSIPMGCFKMDQSRLIFNSTAVDLPVTEQNGSSEEGGEEEGDDEEGEEAFIQAFGETAVQGVTWLANVMGLNVNQPNNTSGVVGSNLQQVPDQQQPTAAPTQPAPV